ncbi:MAG: DUF2950 family protein [Planctomycetota bacterium]
MYRNGLGLATLVVSLAMFPLLPAAGEDERKSPSTKEEKIRRLLEVTGAVEANRMTLEKMIAQLEQQKGLPPGYVETFKELADPDAFVELLVPIYERHLDEKTIDDAIAFFETEEGKVLARSQVEIADEGAGAFYEWFEDISAKATAKLGKGGAGATRMKANEISATTVLMMIVSTEGVWRQIDADRNGRQDYWTQDVAGLCYLTDAAGEELRLMDIPVAQADRVGVARYGKREAKPKSGYWFQAMKLGVSGDAYADGSDPNCNGSNPRSFGFCAYPAEYEVTGVRTYIVNEEGVIYSKDLGPEAKDGAEQWPAEDPAANGWEVVE